MANLIRIHAEYNGPPIMVYESFKQSDIRVTAIYDDSSYDFIIPNSKINVSTLKANTTPTQACVIKYTDPDTKRNYTTSIDIPVIYPVKINAKYVGDYVYIISDFDYNDVEVDIEYNYPDYNTTLDVTQYKINSYSVSKLGPNTFTVTEKILRGNNLSTEITVYGIRKIVEIRAKYVGNPIEITHEIDPADILVEIETVDAFNADRFTVPLTYSEEILIVGKDKFTRDFYINEPLTITTVGSNTKTIHYKDPLTEWERKITIEGIPKVIDFKTTYIGNRLREGSVVSPEDVEALATVLMDINTNKKITQIVDYGEWEFYDAPIVQEFSHGNIKIQYRSFVTYITVPYEVVETLRLRCWYEGVKIEVGSRFSRDDVFAYTVDTNGNVIKLTQYDLIFIDDTIINNDGWNFYQIRVRDSKQKIIGTYAVPGYIPLDKSSVRDFKVMYVEVENNYNLIDCTPEFKTAMTIDDCLYIDWETFAAVAAKKKLYGIYILTAPRNRGLSNKYDEDWEVSFQEGQDLEANILKTYYKEDESWQNRRHLQQPMNRWWKVPLSPQP